MCACFFGLFAAGFPRLANIVLWLLWPYHFNRAFDNIIIPILGVIFLPFTTLFFVLAYPNGFTTFENILIIFGVLLDLGSYFGGAWGGRKYV
jgi:hypothetical protein